MNIFFKIRKYAIDFQEIARRGVTYSVLILLIAAIFFSVEFVIEKFICNNDEVVDIVSAVIGAFAFARLRDAFASLTDRVFFRAQYDYTDAVRELGRVLDATIDLKELLHLLAGFLAGTIKPETVVFFFNDSDEIVALDNSALHRKKSPPLINGYRAIAKQFRMLPAQTIFIDETEPQSSMTIVAKKSRITAIAPFFSKDGAVAFMMLGEKLSSEPVRQKDKALLEVISHQAGMAIENARLYEALREHSEALEKRVAEKTERIRQMYDAQSKFLADIAHEFQTPISILKGNLAIIAQKKTTGHANAIYVAGTTLDRLSRLVTNLLDIAKLNFSKEKLLRKPVGMKALLEEARDDCAILAEDKGVAMSAVSDFIFVSGDKDKLKEVLLNLISNALKHTPAGGAIALTARRIGQNAEIVVSDNGKGIAPESLSQIFERFYKIDKRGSSEGNGIGLHICRQIVEAHHGTIVAESEPGKGSRFVIHLPITQRVL